MLGFDVIARRNADQITMKRAIQEFGSRLEKAGPGAVGLFYYAGHGVQLNGRNYLIPTTAHIDREGDVEIEAVSADWVIEQMRYARNRLNIVILDACRNNPFTRSMRSVDHGLGQHGRAGGNPHRLFHRPGLGGRRRRRARNSPYTEALTHAMREHARARGAGVQARARRRHERDRRQTGAMGGVLADRRFLFRRTEQGRAANRDRAGIGAVRAPVASAAESRARSAPGYRASSAPTSPDPTTRPQAGRTAQPVAPRGARGHAQPRGGCGRALLSGARAHAAAAIARRRRSTRSTAPTTIPKPPSANSSTPRRAG